MTAENTGSEPVRQFWHGTGTYSAPRQGRPLDFATPSEAGRELASARWHGTGYGTVSGTAACGAIDEFGYCIERFHSADCGSLATSEIGGALRDSGQLAAITSRPIPGGWRDQHDAPLTLLGAVEASSGERLTRESQFETGHSRREVTTPARQARFGDYDDPDDAGEDFTARTRDTAARVAAAMGITPQALARERGLQRVGAYALSNAGRMPRRQHPDFGESTRERSDRLRQPVGPAQLRQVNDPGDGLAGAVPQYTYGQLT